MSCLRSLPTFPTRRSSDLDGAREELARDERRQQRHVRRALEAAGDREREGDAEEQRERRRASGGRRAEACGGEAGRALGDRDRKSTRLNSSHLGISYAVFC